MYFPRILLVAGLLATQGCYSYVPTRLESIQPGEAVRLRLSPEEAERLEAIRLTDVRLMDGVVVRNDSDEVLLETPVGRLDPQRGTRPLVQRVNIAVGEIIEVESRRRDNMKTGAAIGAVGVAVGVGIVAALKGGFGQGSNEGEGPLEDRRIPFILRFSLPF
jgi:hypothetical protein